MYRPVIRTEGNEVKLTGCYIQHLLTLCLNGGLYTEILSIFCKITKTADINAQCSIKSIPTDHVTGSFTSYFNTEFPHHITSYIF